MNNKLKNKITLYAGVGTLSVALLTSGLAIYDANFDHTKEVCPIAKVCSISEGMNIGIRHQLYNMMDEYQDKKIDVGGIAYGAYYDVNDIVIPTIIKDELGKETYILPEGYVLTIINGKKVGIKCNANEKGFTPLKNGEKMYDLGIKLK